MISLSTLAVTSEVTISVPLLAIGVTICLALAGYGVAGLVAWGRFTTKLNTITETQSKLVSEDRLRALLAEMRIDIGEMIEKKIERGMGQKS